MGVGFPKVFVVNGPDIADKEAEIQAKREEIRGLEDGN